MLLAFKINAFANRPNILEHSVRTISEAGFKGIGFVFDKPFLWLPDLGLQRINAIQKMLDGAGLTVGSISSCTASGYDRPDDDFTPPGQRFGPSFTSPNADERKLRINHTKRVIDFAVELGVRNVDTSTGYQPRGMDFATTWRYARDCLKELAEYADKMGVSLNIEYEPGEFGPEGLFVGDAHTFLAMAADVGSLALRATWDSGHSYVSAENLPATIELLADHDRLGVVELDDIRTERDPNTGLWRPRHYHLVPGEGEIDFTSVFSTLQEVNFEGPVIVELYSLFDKNPEEACQRTFQYLMEHFSAYLT